jgi:hypothetical protein
MTQMNFARKNQPRPIQNKTIANLEVKSLMKMSKAAYRKEQKSQLLRRTKSKEVKSREGLLIDKPVERAVEEEEKKSEEEPQPQSVKKCQKRPNPVAPKMTRSMLRRSSSEEVAKSSSEITEHIDRLKKQIKEERERAEAVSSDDEEEIDESLTSNSVVDSDHVSEFSIKLTAEDPDRQKSMAAFHLNQTIPQEDSILEGANEHNSSDEDYTSGSCESQHSSGSSGDDDASNSSSSRSKTSSEDSEQTG